MHYSPSLYGLLFDLFLVKRGKRKKKRIGCRLMINPILFYLLALLIVVCSMAVVSLRNIFHAGLFLIGCFLGVAGLYVSLHNYFLAAVQLLIYSGAIAVLILFGIMMTERTWSSGEPTHNRLRLVSFAGVLVLLGFLIRAFVAMPDGMMTAEMNDLMHAIGQALMQNYALAFELISLVLLAALLGAVAVAKEKEE